MKLLLVMPATNTTSERYFSALRRVKTYLRSSMRQMRLNNLMVLHVHKDLTDSLDFCNVGNEFVGGKEVRMRLFGKFLMFLYSYCYYNTSFAHKMLILYCKFIKTDTHYCSNFLAQIAPELISEHVNFKKFSGGHAPRPP